MINQGDYHELRGDPCAFLTAPGHQINGADLAQEAADYVILRVGDDHHAHEENLVWPQPLWEITRPFLMRLLKACLIRPRNRRSSVPVALD
jgi:hypothetical protein